MASASAPLTAATVRLSSGGGAQLVPETLRPLLNASSPSASFEAVLRGTFGHSMFRAPQLDVIRRVLAGKDALVLVPTGGGKSLCFQLPALVSRGVTVVVSPLVALMAEQAVALRRRGVCVAVLGSAASSSEQTAAWKDLRSSGPRTKLLYAAPEMVATTRFSDLCASLRRRGLLAMIAVDEAHCISSWGHDFRPAYRRLAEFRAAMEKVQVASGALPPLPCLAVTATATPKVQRDIVKQLNLQVLLKSRATQFRVGASGYRGGGASGGGSVSAAMGEVDEGFFYRSFNRPNLFFSVLMKGALADINHGAPSAEEGGAPTAACALCKYGCALCEDLAPRLWRLLREEQGGSAIVYALRQKDCEEIARALIRWRPRSGVPLPHFSEADARQQQSPLRTARAFHAGLTKGKRDAVLGAWRSGKCRLVCATIAFGMGVDKADVRFVAHWNLPKSIEAYYQEVGRAGRNGTQARAVLYYDRADVEFLVFMENRQAKAVEAKGDEEAAIASSGAARKALASKERMAAARSEQRLHSLEAMRDFCEAAACRRARLLKHFGETFARDSTHDPKRCCDYCRKPQAVRAALQRLETVRPGGGGGRQQGELAKFQTANRERERAIADAPHLHDLDLGPRKRMGDLRRSGAYGGWGKHGDCMGGSEEEEGERGHSSGSSDSEEASQHVALRGGGSGRWSGGSSFVCASSLLATRDSGSGGDGSGSRGGLSSTLDRLAQLEEEEAEALAKGSQQNSTRSSRMAHSIFRRPG